jgi:hypothetical protein
MLLEVRENGLAVSEATLLIFRGPERVWNYLEALTIANASGGGK